MVNKDKDVMNKDKVKALEMAISQIEKNFGKGAIMRLGSGGVAEGIQVIPTGSISLDIATGIGGFPRGRVVEIYGPESSGKTTLALKGIAEAQKAGGGYRVRLVATWPAVRTRPRRPHGFGGGCAQR